MGVSENGGTPKSSILIGISIINHPFWGTPIFGHTHMESQQVLCVARVRLVIKTHPLEDWAFKKRG